MAKLLLAALLFVSTIASADMIFGPEVVRIRGGVRETPARPVPADAIRVDITLSRENWPVFGIELAMLVSYDGGQTYQLHATPVQIDPHIPTVKEPTPTPAGISFGFTPERRPTHAKIYTNNPGAQFETTVTLQTFNVNGV